MNTFAQHMISLEKAALFAIFGGSGTGRSAAKLQPYAKGAKTPDGKLLNSANGKITKDLAEGL